jgi:hypothetical protein
MEIKYVAIAVPAMHEFIAIVVIVATMGIPIT